MIKDHFDRFGSVQNFYHCYARSYRRVKLCARAARVRTHSRFHSKIESDIMWTGSCQDRAGLGAGIQHAQARGRDARATARLSWDLESLLDWKSRASRTGVLSSAWHVAHELALGRVCFSTFWPFRKSYRADWTVASFLSDGGCVCSKVNSYIGNVSTITRSCLKCICTCMYFMRSLWRRSVRSMLCCAFCCTGLAHHGHGSLGPRHGTPSGVHEEAYFFGKDL